MKIKTILCISTIFILIFIIYLTTLDHKIYYVNLSIDKNNDTYDKYVKDYLESKDKLEKYINGFTTQDDRVTDLIHSIEENKFIIADQKKQTIKNALIKADLVTVFIGLNDINYKVGYSSMNELYEYADSFLSDVNQLLNLIREYCKEDVIILGYYNAYGSYYDEYFHYINRELSLLAKEYKMEFIEVDDIYNVDNHTGSIWMNKEENQKVFSKITTFIDERILKK